MCSGLVLAADDSSSPAYLSVVSPLSVLMPFLKQRVTCKLSLTPQDVLPMVRSVNVPQCCDADYRIWKAVALGCAYTE